VALDKILSSGVLDRPRDHLFQAGLTCFLIHLNDLMQKAKKDGKRIAVVEDIGFTSGSPKDLTTLINDVRNAACHVGSPLNEFGAGRLRMVVVSGYAPAAMVIGDDRFGCEYADDCAVHFGPLRLYMRRHLWRAWREVQLRVPRI
jgi:hypothetical protein